MVLHTTRYLPTRAQRYRDHTHAAASTSREVARGSAGMVAHRDALEQMQRLGRGPVPNIDWQRTLRFAIVGLTLHGPFFYRGFRWLDGVKIGPQKSLREAVGKALLGQVTIFPAYLCLFSAYMGALEGKKMGEIIDKTKRFFLPTFKTGTMFWPLANVANFLYVPATARIAYINGCGIFWNTYMSYANQKPRVE